MKTDLFLSNTSKIFSKVHGRSLWAFPLSLSCCALEFTASTGPRYDLERFGLLPQDDYRNADLLIVAGPITKAISRKVQELYHGMLEPKYVISMGSCANTGGIFSVHSDTVINGVDLILPVDVYIPGCPPKPEALIHGIHALQKKIFMGRKLDEASRSN